MPRSRRWSMVALHLGILFFIVNASNDSAENVQPLKVAKPMLTVSEPQDYPALLHESDVIHYLNEYGEFVLIGDGTYADVTLGEMRDSGKPVVIKTFRDSSFDRIMQEVKMHRFLEPLGISPRLHGLLPCGIFTGNISLVYEYFTESKTLYDWLEESHRLTLVQWLDVCRQTAQHLQLLHHNDVLFNDLHQLNMLVKKELTRVKVYFIDFGSATHGIEKTFTPSYKSLIGHKFLAPEVANYGPTTAKCDIYSLGFIILQVATSLQDRKLSLLASWCLAYDPNDRPTIEQVIRKLDALIFEFCLLNNSEGGVLDCEQRVNKETAGAEKTSTWRHEHVHEHSKNSKSLKVQRFCDKYCLGILPNEYIEVLDQRDFDWTDYNSDSLLSIRSVETIYIAQLKRTHKTVVIKEYRDVSFNYVRKEIWMTSYLASKGVAPNVIGMTLFRTDLRSAGMVQEMFGNGVTLLQYVLRSRTREWDKGFLEMAMRSNISNTHREIDVLVPYIIETYNVPFTSFLNEWVWKICRAKSYRQQLFENIASMIVQHMDIVHRSGYLINNFNLKNILIWGEERKLAKIDEGSDRRSNATGDEIKLASIKRDQDSFRLDDVKVKLIDLNRMSDMEGTKLFKSSKHPPLLPYMAPEVGLCHTTSVQSDIYSLCWALQWLMAEYVSASYAWSRTGADHNQTQQSQRKETFLECQHTQKSHCPNTSDEQATSPSPWWDQHFGGTPSAYSHFNELIHHCLHSPQTQRPHIADIKEAVQRLKDA